MWNREHPHNVRHALFGGMHSVRVWNLVPAPAAPFTAVLACELEPSGSVGTHVQERFPEIVIGVEGTGTVEVNGVPAAFGGPGSRPIMCTVMKAPRRMGLVSLACEYELKKPIRVMKPGRCVASSVTRV